MSRRIKGITIEINGDTTGLDKALSSVEKNARKAQSELNDINKLLKLDPNNTELVAQKMQVLGDAVNATETKLLSLRQAQQQVQQQFDRGEIGADQYRAFMREITDTEESLKRYKGQIQSVQTEQDNLGKATKQMQRFFDATGKSVDDFADVLGADLVRAIKEGRATSSQLENAFDRMGQSALGTNADLERLRASLRTLDNGGSLDDVRRDLQDIEEEANRAEQSVDKLSDALSALGGIAVGIGIGEVIEGALEASDLDAKIDVTFDVPEESKQAVRNALAEVKKYGIDGEEALEGIRRQWALNKNASDQMNASIVEGASAIVKSYSRLDFVELIQEVNEIAGELKVTDDEALNLVNSLLKIGFPDEQIDVIAEYGGQLQRAGFELREIEGLIASAVFVDGFNIDNLLDGLKEARIKASEFGLGLSESFKTTLRSVTGTVKGASEEQLKAMQEGFTKQENALSKSIANKEKQLSKSHSQQQKALDKSLRNESKALEKSLNAQSKALEKAHNQKLKLLDAEYMAKLKIIDEERYNAIKAIEDEIKALEGLTDAEDKASQAKEDAEKRASLLSDVENAKTRKNKQLAIEELAKFDEELRIKAIRDQRKEQIEVLNDEKDQIGDAFDVRKDALKDEYDLKKDQLKEISDAEKEALSEQQTLQREALQERHNLQKEMLQDRLSAEAEAVREAHANELDSFRKMNAQKLELAKNPPDSAQFKAVEEQLEAWGQAIAKGGKEGSQAFRDMIAWFDSLEDGALKNAIGVELLGTKYEDQGEKIIETIMNSKDAMDELEKSATKVSDSTDRMNDGNAMVSVAQAFEKMKVALEPLLFVIAKVIDVVATLMGKFPILSSIIVGLLGVLAMLASALAFLPLLIGTVTTVFATIGPAITFVSGLLATLGGVIIPALGAALAFILSPIGLVIAGIVALIGVTALIIKFWDPIKGFFSDLWTGIVDIFKWAIDFIKDNWQLLLAIVTGPLGLIVLAISKFGGQIKSSFSKMWSSVVGIFKSTGQLLGNATKSMFDFVMRPINALRDGIINAFQSIKSILPSIWGGIVNIIKSPLNFVIKMLNSFIGGLNRIKVPDWIPGVGGRGISIPEIPMLAKGTNYFKGGMAIVGEQGPELLEIPTGSKVHPNDKTMDLLGNGINIEVGQLVVREEADVTKIARQLYSMYDKERRGR